MRSAVFAMVCAGAPLAAQTHGPVFELGAGALSAVNPFVATLALRAGAGWIFGAQNAITVEYSRQTANSIEGPDLGKFSRQFVGIAWQHAFRDAFSDPEPMKQQYLLRLGGGSVFRGTFPEAVGDETLQNAPFMNAGLVIRYPFSPRFAAVGTIEDAIAFLPTQTVNSYCAQDFSNCYVQGGPDYYTYDLPAKTQHNVGLLVTVQLRP